MLMCNWDMKIRLPSRRWPRRTPINTYGPCSWGVAFNLQWRILFWLPYLNTGPEFLKLVSIHQTELRLLSTTQSHSSHIPSGWSNVLMPTLRELTEPFAPKWLVIECTTGDWRLERWSYHELKKVRVCWTFKNCVPHRYHICLNTLTTKRMTFSAIPSVEKTETIYPYIWLIQIDQPSGIPPRSNLLWSGQENLHTDSIPWSKIKSTCAWTRRPFDQAIYRDNTFTEFAFQ